MNDPVALFSRIMYRALSAFGVIYGYRQTAYTAIDIAQPRLVSIERLRAQKIFKTGHGDEYFSDKEGFLQLVGGLEGYAKSSAETRANQLLSFTEASSLVFAHSLVDAVANDLCRVILAIDPTAWRASVATKKVSLKDVLERGAQQVELKLATVHVEGLERESLLKKLDALFSICQPKSDFQPAEDYGYDRAKLEQIDRSRHDLVHGELPAGCTVSVNDIWYLQQTALFFCAMVSKRFGVKADVQKTMAIAVQPKKT